VLGARHEEGDLRDCVVMSRVSGSAGTELLSTRAPVAHVLVAEDDDAARESVTRVLALEGYGTKSVRNGAEALQVVTNEAADLLVLDLMMPKVDGLTVCRRLRAMGDRTPILMTTARTELSDRISGLDAGADDYLPKPYALEELLARVRALLRRANYAAGVDPLRIGDVVIDEASRRVWRGDVEVELTKTEFDLLQLLARNAGIVLSHATIYERIWGYDFGIDSNSLRVYIGYLRRKLDDNAEPRLIQTVRSVGYVLRVA
jgi:two-component system response regulator MprA